MDNYIEEIINVTKLPFNEISKDVKVVMISNKILHISNFIKILDYNKEKLVLKINKNTLEIEGSNLTISLINKGEIIVKGDIFKIGFGESVNEKNK